MIPKPLESITEADINALVANQVEERKTLDFKRDLPGNSEKDKTELRADVSSFANASGGDLVFGVEETNGVATNVIGLNAANIDQEILRIESLIQSQIDPRIPGVASQRVQIAGKGPVLVVRVPKSWRGAHLVKINDTFRMYGRNSKGKYLLDGPEIRSAYLLSEELPTKIKRWRDDRVAIAMADEGPAQLGAGPRLVLHLVPFSAFSQPNALSIATITSQHGKFTPMRASSWGPRINVDGVAVLGISSSRCTTYCQVFRSGCVESVTNALFRVDNGTLLFPSIAYEQEIIVAVQSYLQGLKAVSISPPIAVFVSILGAHGAVLVVSQSLAFSQAGTALNRDTLILPDVTLESFDEKAETAFRPIFNSVWNAFGYERSFNYDQQGNWRGPASLLHVVVQYRRRSSYLPELGSSEISVLLKAYFFDGSTNGASTFDFHSPAFPS